MPIKGIKMKFSKNKKKHVFYVSQGSLNPKIRFLGQKVFPVACLRTDTQTCTQTDTQNDYCGHPFYPSTYHQGSAQYIIGDKKAKLTKYKF